MTITIIDVTKGKEIINDNRNKSFMMSAFYDKF